MTTKPATYHQIRIQIDTEIKSLQSALSKMDEKQSKKPLNYGFAASANYVKGEIETITEHLNNLNLK